MALGPFSERPEAEEWNDYIKNQATEMREFITVSVGLGIGREKGDEGDGEEILLTPNV
ncbi:hypothetical protein [Trichormus azollae]|uniref:hypothetical protein n=1 Tax=Trichormus azollae TaxID=1164 RepID=UPI00325E1DCF